jgi:hypothetical protein
MLRRAPTDRAARVPLFVQSTRLTPDRGWLERSPGGGPEYESLAVAAGEQLVQGRPPLRWLSAGVR